MNKEFLQNLREQIKSGTVTEQEPMNKHTSFSIGGPADVFVQPATKEEIRSAVCCAKESGVPFFVMGNGSNLLVSDDVVEIRKISDDTLLGTSPDITRHFIELRGIGIVDVKTLFGVESVMYNQTIDMVIRLEDWNREANYDRLGLDEEYIEFLGNKVVCYSIPVRPGRNLAVIVESAAINYRAKKMGYNAAQELYNRVTGSLSNNEETQENE